MNKYKDRNPFDTISRCKEFLLHNKILTTEKWCDSIEGVHSVIVRIEDTNIMSNGKGTTKLYALASAYGELIERLSNLAYFRMSSTINKKNNNIKTGKDEIISQDTTFFLDIMSKWGEKANVNIDKRIYKQIFSEKDIKYYIYRNITDENDELILPVEFVDHCYGTNGMVAGNSREEALVQGLSEIFERYVAKKVLKDKIVPPDINKEVIEKMKSVVDIKNRIEKDGKYSIIFKDLSLGKGLPVVGLIMINKEQSEYFVKIGAHPVLKIALERCLTELLQGKNIKKYKGMKKLGYLHDDAESTENILRMFVNGESIYPYEIFQTNNTYESKTLNEEGLDNKEMCKNMLKLIQNMGYSVYIKDESSLCLNSYHIIVPKMSEIVNVEDEKYFNCNSDMEQITYLIKKGKSMSVYDAKRLEHLLSNYYERNNIKIKNILHKSPLKIESKLYSVTVLQLRIAINIYIDNLKNAKELLMAFNELENNMNSKAKMYYKCLEVYLDMFLKGKSNEEIKNVLEKFFDVKLVEKIELDVFKEKEIKLPTIQCENCDECPVRNECCYKVEENLYNRLINIRLNDKEKSND